jgi:hypothetical protein
MSKLRELMGKATPGDLEIGHEVHLFDDGGRLIANTGGASDNFTPNLRETQIANAAKIEYLWNSAPAIATLIEAAENAVEHAGVQEIDRLSNALSALK